MELYARSSTTTSGSSVLGYIDDGDTGFMVLSTALVLLMTPGLALMYGGMARRTSVLTAILQSFVAVGAMFALWYFVGFSLVFGPTFHYIIGDPFKYMCFRSVPIYSPLIRGDEIEGNFPGIVYATYNGMFAVLTPALISGAFIDRIHFGPYLTFLCIWLLLVYCFVAHWTWGEGWMYQLGIRDFAGGLAVETASGFAGLGGLLSLPKDVLGDPKPHNVPFAVLGVSLLWFGWFGFNCGSAYSAGGLSGAALLNTQLCGTVGLLTFFFMEWVIGGRPQTMAACTGAVAGLVTITPLAGYVSAWAAFVSGIIGTAGCFLAHHMCARWKLGDGMGIFSVHAVAGVIGSVLVGALSDGEECADSTTAPSWCVNPGSVTRSFKQVGLQLLAAVVTALYSFAVSYLILMVLGRFQQLTPALEHQSSYDLKEHGESGYHDDDTDADNAAPQMSVPDLQARGS